MWSLHCRTVASDRSIKRWLRPVTNKSTPLPHWLEIKANHLILTFGLNFSISYIHKKKHTSSFWKSNLKILRAKSLTKTHYCFGSHFWFSGDTPIDFNHERLQAPWRALAFREKALNSTPSARIVEHTSGCMLKKTVTSRITLGVSTYTLQMLWRDCANKNSVWVISYFTKKNFTSCFLSVHVGSDLDPDCLTHWWIYERIDADK